MNGDSTKEKRWLDRLICKDETVLAEIIAWYTPYVGTVVWNMVGGWLDQSEAEEILSDVFFALWQKAEQVQEGKLKAFLAGIARNKARDALRRAGARPEPEEDLLVLSDTDPEQLLTEEEERELLRRTLEELPEPDHTIFIRHYFLCQRTAEIAAALGMNKNTVESKLKRGREKLRLALTKGGYTHE